VVAARWEAARQPAARQCQPSSRVRAAVRCAPARTGAGPHAVCRLGEMPGCGEEAEGSSGRRAVRRRLLLGPLQRNAKTRGQGGRAAAGPIDPIPLAPPPPHARRVMRTKRLQTCFSSVLALDSPRLRKYEERHRRRRGATTKHEGAMRGSRTQGPRLRPSTTTPQGRGGDEHPYLGGGCNKGCMCSMLLMKRSSDCDQ